jgi:hypothetical protein
MNNQDYSTALKGIRRQKLFRRATQSILNVQSLAQTAQRLQRKLEVVQCESDQVRELNSELMLTDAKRRAAYMLVWLTIVAAYFLDFVLLSAVAEYFARRVYSDPTMVTLARTVIPAAIITIEMAVACQRAFAREWATEHGRTISSNVWLLFTLLLLLFVPSMLAATHLATVEAKNVWSPVSLFQLLGLLALAVVVHGTILFGGTLAVEAKAYFYVKLRWWKLDGRRRRLENRVHALTDAATQAYVLYESHLQEYRSQFPGNEIDRAALDITTQTMLESAFGNGIRALAANGDNSCLESATRSTHLTRDPAALIDSRPAADAPLITRALQSAA